jgi:hypothetical protein
MDSYPGIIKNLLSLTPLANRLRMESAFCWIFFFGRTFFFRTVRTASQCNTIELTGRLR